MDRRVSTDFSDAVQRELAFLVDERGFRLIEVSDQIVRFASPEVVVTASYYPSEAQVDVTVTQVDQLDRYEELILSGMVGRASPARLLQLAAEKLRTNDPALTGDQSYFTRLGDERRREAEAWTAYHEGTGPQPRGKLP
jgi:hypothetical protein